MKQLTLLTILLIFASLPLGCSRKAAPAGPVAPEVLVTTVTPKDVPRVLERVATLDGFINANINAQVQGYIISRDYQEGSVVKKSDLLFQIDPRPFEAALAQAKGTLAKDQANQVKADADEKRAIDLFNKKVISDQERDTAIAAAGSSRANVEADQAAVKQAELNLEYARVTAPIDGVAGFANNQVGDLVGPSTGPLTTVSQIDPIKAIEIRIAADRGDHVHARQVVDVVLERRQRMGDDRNRRDQREHHEQHRGLHAGKIRGPAQRPGELKCGRRHIAPAGTRCAPAA